MVATADLRRGPITVTEETTLIYLLSSPLTLRRCRPLRRGALIDLQVQSRSPHFEAICAVESRQDAHVEASHRVPATLASNCRGSLYVLDYVDHGGHLLTHAQGRALL